MTETQLPVFETSKASFDLARFRKPRAVDRPVPFYSWNERMEPRELRRQINEIAKAGWGGAFVHSRIGLTTPYLGDEWFKAVDATVKQCEKKGLKVWLYDEDKWPSGFSGGTVPLADKSFRVQTLIARPEGRPTPPDCEPIGLPAAGLQFFVWTAPLGHDWFNGTCYTGLMHRKAMRKFLDDAYEPYFTRYRDKYGSIVVGEFTDEPCSIFRARLAHASVPFTPELIERFEQMHGYSPLDHLHLLFTEGDNAARFRIHYFRTANWLFEHNFSGQLGDWCADHGIALTGHYMCEDGLFLQQLWGVKVMPNYRHEGIPGIDHLCRFVGNVTTVKQCQSVVNQYGKSRMLSELYGVDGGSLTFKDRAWIGAQQMCLGVNLLNPHLSLYTMTGCRKRDYPQNIFYQQPFWPLNRLLDDQLTRVCVALSQGTYRAEMIVLHPGESAFAHWHTKVDPERGEDLVGSDWNPIAQEARQKLDVLDKDYREITETILGAQRTFDYGDETILADDGEALMAGGRPVVRIRRMDYPLVVVPSMTTIAETTVALLEKFMALGGPVVRCGTPPALMDGRPSERLAGLMARIPEAELGGLASRLTEFAPPLVQARGLSDEAARQLYVHVRDFEDGDRLVYLVNLHRSLGFRCDIQFSGSFRSVKQLDTPTGKANRVEAKTSKAGLTVSLPFTPAQTHLLWLSAKKGAGKAVSLVPGPIVDEHPTSPAAWSAKRLDDNALTLDFAFWKQGKKPWSDKAVPVIGVQEYLNSAAYDGPLTLRYPVRASGLSPGRTVHLVVEYCKRYRISVNGTPVKYAGLPAWRDFRYLPIDITNMLREGDNEIELHCRKFQHGDLRSVEDAFARYGTEIESIYLVGDFAVCGKAIDDKPVAGHWKNFGLPPIDVQCFELGSFTVTDPSPLRYGDTTTQGLPFYAGRLELSVKLPALDTGKRWFLAVDKLDCPIAEVAVDGTVAGHLMLHPLEVELPCGSLREGATLTLSLYGTLRNLLGPHHNHEGELAACGPNSFSASCESDEHGHNVWVQRWAEGRPVQCWSDRYCMVSFGNLGTVKLIARGE